MVDPVNVWGAVDERGRPRPRTCRFEKDSAKKAALDEHYTDAETWVDLQCCHGWTVRPMRLVDGHGEQAFDPKLFDTVREIVKFYVDEKLRTESITTELIFKTLGLPLPNASSELGEKEGE